MHAISYSIINFLLLDVKSFLSVPRGTVFHHYMVPRGTTNILPDLINMIY